MANNDSGWSYLFDEKIGAFIRSDRKTFEYFDVYSNSWEYDAFGAATFSGQSNDAGNFVEIPSENVEKVIKKISHMRR